jgi:integrase
MYQKLVNEIKKYNQKSIFKIRYRKLKNKYTIFLDFQREKRRKTINIGNCFVVGLPSTFNQDKKMIFKASKEQQIYDKQYDIKKYMMFKDIELEKGNVLTFFRALRDSKDSKATKKSWNNTINHFEVFTKGKITFKDVDLEFCEKFRTYLLSKVSKNGTATYFSVFRAMLNQAMKHRIITMNPAKFVKNPKQQVDKVFLITDEIKLLASTESYHPHITNAFLFSCYTGLRISDIRKLTWDKISNAKLDFIQKKTSVPNKIAINESALDILKNQKLSTTGKRVFEVPKSDSNSNKHLKEWVKRSGITKHITFSCSRHTFATLCLTYDVDLYTVSKLLGHTDIKNTQIYAKIIDKKKDEAMRKLPVIKLK